MTPSSSVIDVENLHKTYRHGFWGRKKVSALRGVSLQVQQGEIFGLLGPNGAGKTTLIKVLLGIVRKSGGAARLLGKSAGNRERRRRVGYLPEHHRIPQHLTGNTTLEFYGSLSGMRPADIRRKRTDLLGIVGLERWGKTPIKKYSKGMLQRLGLAQAMLHDPELLILDEPTDGVDPVGRAKIRDLLKQLKDRGKSVFLNSHLLQEVELVCDRVAILDHGEVRDVGPIGQLTQQHSTEVIFSLNGEESAVRAAFDGLQIVSLDSAGADRIQAVVLVDDQATLDRSIDALRRHAVSIAGVSRRQVTLEHAFLRLVREAPTDQ